MTKKMKTTEKMQTTYKMKTTPNMEICNIDSHSTTNPSPEMLSAV